jgi:membrane protein
MGAHHVSGVTDDDGSGAGAGARAAASPALRRLPPRLQRAVGWLLSRWLGRIVLDAVRDFVRLEMFDRSMTIAAQFFTAIFPVLILFTTWASSRDADRVADVLSLPEETRSLLGDATQGADSATFGVVGTLIVLASATSLSRALTRCFVAIWAVPRPRSRLASVWRWLAVILVLTLSLVVVRTATEPVDVRPPREMLPLLASFALEAVVALFVPWVLLANAVHPRLLAPGALLFASLMLLVRPATAAWLPHALDVSADRYGPIGVAFTYLACLYTASFCFLGTAVLGQVVATDRGWLGTWIRGADGVGTTHRGSDGT